MAPSWNTEAHKRFLSTGGEFVTHIWSILSHCGVQGSKLWQQQEEVREEGRAANQQPGATGGHQDPAQQQGALNVHHVLEPQTQATGTGDRLRARCAWSDNQGEASTSSSSINEH
uniref:Uncharacterized protein n=1 Tax=Arundo donax TaxID=35708 RepID=A0A0A9HVP7_ARUDO